MSRYTEDRGAADTWKPAPGGWPVPGQPGTLVLRPDASAGQYLRFVGGYLPLLILLFIVVLLLGAILFETAVPGFGMVGGTVAGLLAAGGLGFQLFLKVRRMLTGTVVVVSEAGIELRDTLGVEMRLAWRDMTAVGRVTQRFNSRRPVRIGAGNVVRAPEFASKGLIGWGERVLPKRAPAHMRRRMAAQPRDPRTGRTQVAIPFDAAGPVGPGNPLLDLARRNRPDLFG